jgi:hypothetical protein
MIRPYRPDDDELIEDMLASEDIGAKRMCHKLYDTYCVEHDGELVGFFTMREEQGFPALQHFYVVPSHRKGIVSREMMRAIKEMVGGSKVIVHVERHRGWLRTLIENYFRTVPYGETLDKYWYLVEVKR